MLSCGAKELDLRSRHTPIIEKLQPKGNAMHAYGISVYYAYTRNQIKWPWEKQFEMNPNGHAKVKLRH